MNIEKVKEYLLASMISAVIILILMCVLGLVLMNTIVDSLESRVNNMNITCSEFPFIGSNEIVFKGEKLYCAINSKFTPATEDLNLT